MNIMQNYLPIIIGVGFTTIGVVVYKQTDPINKVINYKKALETDLKKISSTNYTSNISPYYSPTPHRIYDYKIKKPNYDDMTSKYHMDLMGNYATRDVIDNMLKDYMKKNEIKEKYLVILGKAPWCGRFEFEENTGNECLTLKFDNDPLEIAGLHGRIKGVDQALQINQLLNDLR